MAKRTIQLNEEVTRFLDQLRHPLRQEIEALRNDILQANPQLAENIKWNGPNYCYHGEDRITMKIRPPKQIQLIFHRGAKVLQQPKDRLIVDCSGLLTWKTNDRAIAAFTNLHEVTTRKADLATIIDKWITAKTR